MATPADPVQTARPGFKVHPGLGWWAVLIVAGFWIADGNPSIPVPRNYFSMVVTICHIGYALVAARAAFALLFRNRSWWWVAYALLLIMIEPLVTGETQSASNGWQ
jgi:hypothetical protein